MDRTQTRTKIIYIILVELLSLRGTRIVKFFMIPFLSYDSLV